MAKITSEQLATEIVTRIEANEKEKAELKAKAEKAAAEKTIEAETQAKADVDAIVSTAVEIAMKKMEERFAAKERLESAKGAAETGAGEPPRTFGIISDKYKMDQESQMILDALNSDRKSELKFKFDVQDSEDRLRHLYRQAAREGKKADLDGATSYGSQLLWENWGTDLYMRMADMDGDLLRLFPKVGMTSFKHHISELLADITVSAYFSYQNQNLAIENVTATSPTTGDLSLEARTFVAKTNVYNLMADDTKINLVRGVRQKMAMKLNSKISAAILNGDTTATHMDEDLEAAGANIPEAMFKGLRKLIMAGSLGTDGDATFTLANLEAIEKLMGKYAIGPNKRTCPLIVGIKSLSNLKALYRASSTTPVAADFVLRNGEVDLWNGHDVIVSEHQREDLEIDGYEDETGTSGAQGFLNLVQTNMFVAGIKQEMVIKIIPEDLKDRKVLAGLFRMDFQPFETPSTSIPSCAGLYGFTA